MQDLDANPFYDLLITKARLIDGTILQVGKSNEIRLALLAQFRTVVGWVAVLAMFIGVVGGLLITRSTLQPINELIQVVQEIIRTGRTHARVPSRGPTVDTVDELVRLVNTMLDRITGLIQAMGEALDNVAHVLRTPMARLPICRRCPTQPRTSALRSCVRSTAAVPRPGRP